ncbi:hypothetical protein PA598K_04190 [Paenibacillus sp. 598K]|uniref:ketopantoate hydroxymethyltransferase n=1 Tax=Paenibacillus sp. 598K TaxID=1117987 RepID=UPI000FFAD1C7|nr:ketopantoate hydroxymethyltransferase [Paenibacillus sp. 598K]GBF75759.1 hypothetical protein PA598K_04190 [Paenibacillus sp. 598K]
MIQPSYLHEIAEYTGTRIAFIVLNETVVLSEFLVKEATANALVLEYLVPKGLVNEVSKVELKNSEQQVISTRSVKVPIVEDTIMRHVMTVEEVN